MVVLQYNSFITQTNNEPTAGVPKKRIAELEGDIADLDQALAVANKQ